MTPVMIAALILVALVVALYTLVASRHEREWLAREAAYYAELERRGLSLSGWHKEGRQ